MIACRAGLAAQALAWHLHERSLMRPVTVYEPPSLATLHPLASLRRLRHHGNLIWTLTRHRLAVRYTRTRLGAAWAMLQPLSFMVVFTLMFTILGRSPSADVPYPLFAYAALVPWTAFSSGLSNAASSLTSHASLLTKVAFPREILPGTYVAAALADLAVASTLLLLLMLWFGVPLTLTVWWTLPAVALMVAFLAGLSLLVSALQVHHRDIAIAMPILLQVWMFATPIIYPLEMVEHRLSPLAYTLYTLNPMVAVTGTFRAATALGTSPDLGPWPGALLTTLVVLPIGYLYFRYCERTLADAV